METLKQHMNGIILFLFELLVGILLLINPAGFTIGIITIAGIVLTLLGIINIIKYFRTDAGEAVLGQTLFKGLICLLAGLFCIIKSEWFVITFPVLTILYGVVTLVAGLGKLQMTVDMLRLKKSKWYFALISALLSIIFAVVILKNPFATTAVLWMFTGIALIVEAAIDMAVLIIGIKSDNEADVKDIPKKDSVY